MRLAIGFSVCILLVTCCGPTQAMRQRAPADGFIDNAGIRLNYHLDRPAGPGPFPAVVVGHGSGRVTKDQQGLLADPWIARGFAVLRYDKRGVGESTGTYSGVGVKNGDQMFADLSSDMAAGVEFLRTQPDIDGRRIGLMGWSQAGWIIPLAAARARPAFMILASGPTVSIGEENYYSKFAEFGGTSLDRAYDELTRFSGARGFDPVPTLEHLAVPGLWLLGQADESIPERNTAAILKGLIAKGRPFEVVEYAGANHGLFDRSKGEFAPYWNDVDRWLKTRGLLR
jgi:dienelactone hydrolase